MNDYYQVRLDIADSNETITDLFAAFLSDYGYESFVPDENGLTAYISASLYNEDCVNSIIKEFPMPVKVQFQTEYIKGKDWNEEWEKNYFQPILIDNKCVIHSTFHKDIPKADYDIIIDPKMAFGTGHHSTTSLIIRQLLTLDLANKVVTDMGTGTGILAILSAMRGAVATGIEIDAGAYENAIENATLNNVEIKLIHGDASQLENIAKADVFIANINRNIILADLGNYSKSLNKNAIVLFSGFYESDIPMIEKSAKIYGLEIVDVQTDNNWAVVKLNFNKE